jgi:cell division protein FtsL
MVAPSQPRQPNLTATVLADLGRHPFTLLCLGLVVASAFGVVLMAHKARLRNVDLENELAVRDRLEIEWRHLLLEESAIGEHSRVGRLAEQQLQMRLPSPMEERIVRFP